MAFYLLFFAAALAADCRWTELGPFHVKDGEGYDGSRIAVTGRVTGIAVDELNPATVYLGTALGGVWKSQDDGATWKPMSDVLPTLSVGAIVISPANTIYVGSGEGNLSLRETIVRGDRVLAGHLGQGIFRSTNGGHSWEQLGAQMFAGASFFGLFTDPVDDKRLYAATSKGLFRTIDRGETWNSISEGLPPHPATSFALGQGKTAFVAVADVGIFKSDNIELEHPQWTRLFGGLPLSNLTRISLSVSPSAPKRIVSVIADLHSKLRGLYVSEDSGEHWTRLAAAPDLLQGQGFFNMMLALNPNDGTEFYYGGVGNREEHGSSIYKANLVDGVWKFSPTGGQQHVDFHAIAFSHFDLKKVYVGNDGGIWRSDDKGQSWVALNRGVAALQFTRIDQSPISTAILLGGTQDNGTLLYNGTNSWKHADDGDGGYVAIDKSHVNTVYNSYFLHRIARSDRGGVYGSFAPKYPTPSLFRSAFIAPFLLDPSDTKKIYLGLDKLYLSSDRGESWHPISDDLTYNEGAGYRSAISALSFSHSGVLFLGTTDGRLWRVDNLDVVPKFFELTKTNPLRSGTQPVFVTSVFAESNFEVLVALDRRDGQRLARYSIDPTTGEEQVTWLDEKLPKGTIYSIDKSADGMVTYLGTETGVYVSSENGWKKLSEGLPSIAVFHVQRHPNFPLLRAATHGRGVWELSLVPNSCEEVELYLRDNPLDQGRDPKFFAAKNEYEFDSPSIRLDSAQASSQTILDRLELNGTSDSQGRFVSALISNRGKTAPAFATLYVSYQSGEEQSEGERRWVKLHTLRVDSVGVSTPQAVTWQIPEPPGDAYGLDVLVIASEQSNATSEIEDSSQARRAAQSSPAAAIKRFRLEGGE
ncbi:hypothetical protein [Rhizobium phaseoli]|uniref:hypothetical protein n=1 Tax=Rhizobium phaseoli TaxID=396 RepID=UPI0011AEB2C2|nr:hypothetical protein [Rhizobium phaseoli]